MALHLRRFADIPLPHPDAKAFEVKEADGRPLGVLYMDFFTRASKSQGAWCGEYRDHKWLDGKEINPVVTIVCNSIILQLRLRRYLVLMMPGLFFMNSDMGFRVSSP